MKCVDLHSYDLVWLLYDNYKFLASFLIDIYSEFVEYVSQGNTVIYLLLCFYTGLLESAPQGVQ